MVNWLFGQGRTQKRIISIALDSIFISTAYWLAFFLKFDDLYLLSSIKHWAALALLLSFSLMFFIRFGLYRAILRYVDLHAFATITLGIVLPILSMEGVVLLFNYDLPISIPVIYSAWAIILCGGIRLVIRAVYQQSTKHHKQPVIIYGAGEAGRQLANSLHYSPEYRVVAFVDDNSTLTGSISHGVRVYLPQSIPALQEHYQIKKILLAMPSISKSQRRKVIDALPNIAIDILTMPGIADIISGREKIEHLREVNINDLLGRETVEPINQLLNKNINNKTVMVTGAGGSIGSELCRQILNQKPHQLLLFESSELALYTIAHELKSLNSNIKIIPILASVTNPMRLQTTLKAYQVNTIYHAAAYKHVPLVEWHTTEGIRNNCFGTLYTAQAAVDAKVETFVLVSTDKAVRPTNVMGATKRFAELICQALNKTQNTTTFCMVRFGNVLESSGSVIPLMKKQIHQGGPVTVTHKDITRYFMAIPEAAQLVIQAGAMAKGGEVFVLDMGAPIKIYDLAQKLIRLMGHQIKDDSQPQGSIEIVISGLRPGEKLYEELLINTNDRTTNHPRIRMTHEEYLDWYKLYHILDKLDIACTENDQNLIRKLLLEAPIAYQPTGDIHDLIWQQSKFTAQPEKCN